MNNDPSTQAFLNVYMIPYNAASSSTAQLIHGPIAIPGGAYGGPGGYGTGVFVSLDSILCYHYLLPITVTIVPDYNYLHVLCCIIQLQALIP